MRKLLWFTIGFAISTAVYAYCLSDILLMILIACFCVAGIGSFLYQKTTYKVLAVVLVGIIAGFIYGRCYEGFFLADARAFDGREITVEMEASDYSFETDYGCAVDGRADLGGKTYRLRLYYYEKNTVKPGDVLSGKVSLRYTPEGGAKDSTYHKGEGLFLLAYAEEEIHIAQCEKIPGKHFASVLRKNIAERIMAIFPEDTAAFAKALLLGDDSDITFQDNIAFQRSGIRHVIAVSGLHVSILFSVLYFFTGRRKLLTLFTGFPLLFVFAAVAGFSPSVVRACIMQGLMILSVALDREYDPGTALSFAVLTMLVINPLTVTSVSFQLSVGCMIGIFLFSGPVREYLLNEKRLGPAKGKSRKARLKRWLVGSVSVSVSAMSVTLPLCAVYFGAVSVVGILTNLVTLWLITYIFIGIIAACILSLIWLPLGSVLAYLISWPARFILLAARILGQIPFGNLYTESPYTVLWVIMTCLLLALLLLSKKKPVALFATAVTVFYVLSAIAPWSEPYWSNYTVSVLDVGQRQCVLLQCKGSTYMVDCGGNNGETAATVALNALGARGIGKLDGLILTHYDTDHCNGAAKLMDVMKVEKLYLPDVEPENKLRTELEQRDMPIQWLEESISFSCGTGKISIFPAEYGSEGNESSLCILFQAENCDILITGDRDIAGEEQLLKHEDIPDLEVMVVGHHGASTSTGTELLNKTHPEVAVISVGEDNRHRHPDGETLDRLNRLGCIIRRTDLEGTITIRG